MITFKKSTLYIALFTSLVFACQSQEKKTTDDGVEYYLLSSENGEAYEQGDYAIFYLKLMNEADSVLVDSKEVGMMPLIIDSAIFSKRGDLFSIIGDMKVGDSVKSVLTASEVFSKAFRQPLSDGMNLNDRITVIATAKQKLDSAGFIQWRADVVEESRIKREAQAKKQIAENKVLIEKYIEENSLTLESTESGLLYVIEKEGNGSLPQKGQKVFVNYKGMLLNGKVFDTSIEEEAKASGTYDARRTYGPIDFTLGSGQVIQGWDEGIMLLPVGSKATFIIPSDLAYGPRGRGADIPPNTPLVFEVELVSAE